MVVYHRPEVGYRRLHGPFSHNHTLGLAKSVNEDRVDIVCSAVALERSQVGSGVIGRYDQYISIFISIFGPVTGCTIPNTVLGSEAGQRFELGFPQICSALLSHLLYVEGGVATFNEVFQDVIDQSVETSMGYKLIPLAL